MYKFYIHIENGGVEQAGPVKCRRDQFDALMAKVDALVEEGATVSISRYDPELAEKEYEDDNVSGRPQPKYNHGYTTVAKFPQWPGL